MSLLDYHYIGQVFFGIATAAALLRSIAKLRQDYLKDHIAANSREPEVEIPQPKGSPPGAGEWTRKMTPQERQHWKERHDRKERYVKLGVGVLFSAIILVPCLYLVLTSPDTEKVKWSQSTVALILGYWLKAIN